MPALRYGGPIFTVLRLCQELQRHGVKVDVATTNADGRGVLRVPTDRFVDVQGLRVRYFARNGSQDYAFSSALAAYLARNVSAYDLVHITSTFSFPALVAGHYARKRGVPYVVSPHGSLQQWSLAQKRWKKAPYWWLFERRHLLHAAAIHACADSEAADVHRALPGARVFVVPNGNDPIAVAATERVPNRIVFLSRIHRKKGLDVLIPALSLVARELPDVETIVAGPDQDAEWARVAPLLESVSPRPRVTYVGPVFGPEKNALLASARAFVLPSHSENFGMVVVEAMACGTPVVVSRNCPWQQVEERGAGHWVENTPAEVASALLSVLKDDALAARMGAAGVVLAAEFDWSALALRMRQSYAEILGQGADEAVAPTGGAAA